MKAIKFNDPWCHYEIFNFLIKKDFNLIYDYTNRLIELNSKKIENFDRYIYTFEPKSKYNNFFQQKFVEIIKILYPEELKCEFIFDVSLSICNNSFNRHKIHTDIHKKLFTGIFYVSEKGNGTELYSENNKTSLKKTIEWNQNKLFLFKRTDNSWHNFNALGLDTPRVVYNLNIFEKGFGIHGGVYKKLTGKICE